LVVGNEALESANGYWCSFDAVNAAPLALILLLAHTSADCREAVFFTNDVGCAEIVLLQNRANKVRDIDFNRTTGYASRIFAINAPLGLQ
jgi:hypothetical protein